MTADDIIRLLGLKPHPEGGQYTESYRSPESIAAGHLPPRYGADRAFGTAIYYLLTPGTFSAMHRLASDEIFHFYLGDPVEMLNLHQDGTSRLLKLGKDLSGGMIPQAVVPADPEVTVTPAKRSFGPMIVFRTSSMACPVTS